MPLSFALQNKVIAITGGTGGIGLATTKLLLEEGARVSVADVSGVALEELSSTVADLPGELLTTTVDVRKPEQVNAWIAKTVQRFGKLDGAANLAGVVSKAHLVETVAELNDEDWHFTFDVNIHGLMYCMRAELQNMNDGASIVNASSIAGLIGFPKHASYVASKHAVIGLTKAAAKDFGDRAIRVNCVAPGPIDTPMMQAANDKNPDRHANLNWQIKRIGQPEEVATTIAWLLSPMSSYVTGIVHPVDGGWTC